MNCSPLSEAVARRLELGFPNKVARGTDEPTRQFRVVSYLNDFGALWRLDDSLIDELLDKATTLIVVWDGTPTLEGSKEINTRDYLTAADWAVAVSLVASRRAMLQGKTELWRLLVIDNASGQHRSSRSLNLFLRLQNSNRPILPWVRFHPAGNFGQAMESLAEWSPPRDGNADLEMLRQMWAAMLFDPARSSDRHAIANLVGPRLLLGGLGENQSMEAPDAAPLASLLRALKLFPREELSEPGPWIPESIWGEVVDGFVLVDDMHDLGWAKFLELALELKTEDSRLKVLSKIDPEDACDGNKVLFLDLRLFSREGLGAEQRYVESLCRRAKNFASSRGDLAWPGFSDNDFDAAKRYVERPSPKTLDHLRTLTFLPRLLALQCPRMPIVLFSSTGRREVITALQGYGNICTEFEKPRFFGQEPSDVLHETKNKFVSALKHALRIARGNRVCTEIVEGAKTVRSPKAVGKIVEVYVDESQGVNNQGPFAIGGVVLAYPDEGAVQRLDNSLKQQGLVWGLADGYPPARLGEEMPLSYLPKRPSPKELIDALGKLETIFDAIGVSVHAFGLLDHVSPIEDRMTPESLLDERAMDNRFRSMLTEVLEGVLFGLIASDDGRMQEIRIDAGTRTPEARHLGQLDSLRVQFGILGLKKYDKYFSLTSCEVWPIVAKLLEVRKAGNLNSRIKRARGVQLADYEDLKMKRKKDPAYYEDLVTRTHRPRPQQIHFLADWIARLATMETNETPAIASRWFSRGFLEWRSGSYPSWISAGRAAAEKDYVEAALAAHEGLRAEIGVVAGSRVFSAFVRQKAKEWADTLRGELFVGFCDELDRQEHLRQVTIGGLPGNLNADRLSVDVKSALEFIAPVCSLKVVAPSSTSSNPIAVADFASRDGAQRALRALVDGLIRIDGRRLLVHRARKTDDRFN